MNWLMVIVFMIGGDPEQRIVASKPSYTMEECYAIAGSGIDAAIGGGLAQQNIIFECVELEGRDPDIVGTRIGETLTQHWKDAQESKASL